jgi:hypothetical protein
MEKHMLRPLLLGFCISLLLSGCAVTPAESLASDAAPKAKCEMTIGTHIRMRSDDCMTLPGQVYTQSDIEGTGAFSVAEALQRLDPRITIR